jgi:hypothetical protein
LSLQNALHKAYSHDPKVHNLKQVGAKWWQNNFMHHPKNSKCKRRLAQNLYLNSKGSQISSPLKVEEGAELSLSILQ